MTRCFHKDCTRFLFSDEELEVGICEYHIDIANDIYINSAYNYLFFNYIEPEEGYIA